MPIGNEWFCHRQKESSLSIFGRTLPLCSRCTGLIIGTTFAYPFRNLFAFSTPALFFLSFAFAFPGFVDSVTQFMGLRKSNNALRLVTGISGGIAVVFLALFLEKLIF